MADRSHDTWVFAYGSLMWNPGFPAVEACHARVDGYHRAFCVYSVHYRGTPRRPGLVLGLDRGGTCEGVAFRLPADSAADSLRYLRHRELIYGVYREAHVPLTLLVESRPSVRAITFIVERAHPAHAGSIHPEKQALLIRGARGVAGTNLDYLVNSLNRLAAMGIREPRLDRLSAIAGGTFAARSIATGHSPARPRSMSLAQAWGTRPLDTPKLERERRFTFRNKLA